MTRRDKLIAMNGAMLIEVADKLGVKVNCNKTRTSLKEAKAKVADRIIAKEEELATEFDADEEVVVGEVETTENAVEDVEKVKAEEVVEKKKPTKKSNKKFIWSRDKVEEVYIDLSQHLSDGNIKFKIYEKIANLFVVKSGKKSVFEIRVTRAGVVYSLRESDVLDGVESVKIKNYYMPVNVRCVDNYLEIFNRLVNEVLCKYVNKEVA